MVKRSGPAPGWNVADQIVLGLVDEAGTHTHRVAELLLEPRAEFMRVGILDVRVKAGRAFEVGGD